MRLKWLQNRRTGGQGDADLSVHLQSYTHCLPGVYILYSNSTISKGWRQKYPRHLPQLNALALHSSAVNGSGFGFICYIAWEREEEFAHQTITLLFTCWSEVAAHFRLKWDYMIYLSFSAFSSYLWENHKSSYFFLNRLGKVHGKGKQQQQKRY